MIKEICVCDFCGKESDDRLTLKRIKIYDSSVCSGAKAELDVCNDCLSKIIKPLEFHTYAVVASAFNLMKTI